MLSPYLRRPLRSLDQALADVARNGKRGRALPPPLLSFETAAASDVPGAPRDDAGAAVVRPCRASASVRFRRH